MENKPGARKEPPVLPLSEKGFVELERVQITLHLMGRIARGDAIEGPISADVMMSRMELYRVFMQLSQEIGDVLEQVWSDHCVAYKYRTQQ